MSQIEKFVEVTISKQVAIAKTVVLSTKQPVVLFDRSLLADRTIMVDKIRVEVDASGRKAVLSAGAQSSFTFGDYCRFLPGGFSYRKINEHK